MIYPVFIVAFRRVTQQRFVAHVFPQTLDAKSNIPPRSLRRIDLFGSEPDRVRFADLVQHDKANMLVGLLLIDLQPR